MDIFENVKHIIISLKQDENLIITREMTWVGDLDMNSIDIFSIAEAVEERFDFQISDRKLGELKTVGELVDYITKNI